jgi:uncharacterized delta-60 repeat protein
MACGGAVSVVTPVPQDSGAPIAQVDAGSEDDASATADSTAYADADAGVVRDAPLDTAALPPEAEPPACSMQLDPTFGVGGISTIVNPPYSWSSAIAFESSGKMLVALQDPTVTQAHGVAVARLDAAGRIDPTYGDGGFEPLVPPGSVYHDDEDPGPLVIQPDGKPLVEAWNANTPALGRLNRDGTLDTSFGSNAYGPGGGFVEPTTPWPNWWRAVALFADGSIVVGGSADFNTGGQTRFLAKYDRDGVNDTTFGAGGSVSDLSIGPCYALLAQTDGSFLVGGDANANSQTYTDIRPAVTRYTTAGALDVAFGSGGTATAPMTGGGGPIVGMATQSTGAIVVAVAMGGSPNDDFFLVRYTPTGQLDPTFGEGGVARTDFFGARDYAMGLSVLPDDTLLVAGTVNEPTDASSVVDFGIAQYTANGQPDTRFAPGGKLVTRFPDGGVEELRAQARHADGKLVVAGYGVRGTDAGEDQILTLARYACR